MLLPSGIVVANMLTPGFVFKIVKLPNTNPVLISVDCTTTSLVDTTVITVNSVLNVLAPLLADNVDIPITSPIFILAISKDPELDVNKEDNISISPAS